MGGGAVGGKWRNGSEEVRNRACTTIAIDIATQEKTR